MSDQTIQYDEEMVGANHPTKPDTLNRLALVECDSDGKGLTRYLKKQTSDPETGTGEGCLFAKEVDSELLPHWRGPDNGEVKPVIGGWAVTSRQHITVTVGASTVNTTITAVDSSKTLLFTAASNQSRADKVSPDWCGGITCRLTSATNVESQAFGFISGASQVMDIEVVEFVSAPKSMQEILLTTNTVALSTSIDPNKSFLLPLGSTGAIYDAVNNAYATSYYILDANTVQNRYGGNDARYALVIEGF